MVGFEQELLAVFFVGHSCDLAFLGRRSLGFSKCPGTRGLLLFMDLHLGASQAQSWGPLHPNRTTLLEAASSGVS